MLLERRHQLLVSLPMSNALYLSAAACLSPATQLQLCAQMLLPEFTSGKSLAHSPVCCLPTDTFKTFVIHMFIPLLDLVHWPQVAEEDESALARNTLQKDMNGTRA